MERRSVTHISLPILLLFLTAIPVLMAAARVVQVPMGALPDDALKYTATPASLFLHATGGVLFGLLGPLQFGRSLTHRFGRFHRVSGRAFVISGALLALSGLRLVWAFPGTSTPVLDVARIAASAGLGLTLWWGVRAAQRKNIPSHRAWMIRAYALGMGAATIAFIMFPIYFITGEAPTGLLSDLLFVGSWVINIAIAEWVIGRIARAQVLSHR